MKQKKSVKGQAKQDLWPLRIPKYKGAIIDLGSAGYIPRARRWDQVQVDIFANLKLQLKQSYELHLTASEADKSDKAPLSNRQNTSQAFQSVSGGHDRRHE